MLLIHKDQLICDVLESRMIHKCLDFILKLLKMAAEVPALPIPLWTTLAMLRGLRYSHNSGPPSPFPVSSPLTTCTLARTV